VKISEKNNWVPNEGLVTQQVGQQIRRPARLYELVGQPRLASIVANLLAMWNLTFTCSVGFSSVSLSCRSSLSSVWSMSMQSFSPYSLPVISSIHLVKLSGSSRIVLVIHSYQFLPCTTLYSSVFVVWIVCGVSVSLKITWPDPRIRIASTPNLSV